MSDESFKQLWFDGDHARHHATTPQDVQSQIQTLTQRTYELTVLVTTLVDLLAQANQVDANVLIAKVEGQLESEIQAMPAAVAPKGAMTHCARCRIELAMAQATMTASGLLCDRCVLSA